MKKLDSSQCPQQMPQMQRVIVTLGGASIFFASLLSMVTGALQVHVPDWIVAVMSFALGAATAAWVLHGTRSNNG